MKFQIEECRKRAGVSQEELAKRSGVSRSIISGLESGRVCVTTTSTLERIAQVLEVPVRDLIKEVCRK